MKHVIICQGDSLTDPTANMGPEYLRWTELLAAKLLQRGARNLSVCDLAQSGAKTDDLGKGMLKRFSPFLRGIPDIAILWGGTNDIRSISTLSQSGGLATATSNGHGYYDTSIVDIFGADQAGYNLNGVQIHVTDSNHFTFLVNAGTVSPATGAIKVRSRTKLNLRALIKWVKFGCLGAVRGQANLPGNCIPNDRYVVLNDTSSTGGRTALSVQTPTITGSVTAGEPTVWECRTGVAGEAGWGRIAVAATPTTHCSKIIIVGQHYLNYSSGGDTLATPYADFDTVTGIRSLQIAAAAAEGAIYADLYSYLRNLIETGVEMQGSHSWHIGDGNEHLSILGHQYVADCLYGVINAQTGWLDSLKF